jgi:hypothetical protein
MEDHGEIMYREDTPDSSTRALWKFYLQSSGSKQEERGKGMMILVL